MTRARGASGFSLAETLISMIVGGLVLASILGALVHQQRFYMVAGDISETRRDVDQVDKVLAPELLALNPSAGDITFAASDSMRLRVFRGIFALCDKRVTTDVQVTVRRVTREGPELDSDSALVYSRGTQVTLADDHWEPVRLGSVSATTCPDSAPGWSAIAHGLSGIGDQIPIGAPVRVFSYANYWLGREAGYWVLKTDALGSARVLGGPLMPASQPKSSALQFRYLDEAGNVTTNPPDIVDVEIVVGAKGSAPTTREGIVYQVVRRRVLRLRNADQ
ncbi:MAG: hypothetical protein JSU87_15415 [Gemmatimonadota bacterium]|nr:MAG: hypothetical protein JSU87_15415 [Gemmatimonadota bacterium]